MYAKIENGICNTNIPTVGTLKNGNTVSGYNLLTIEQLAEEGWYPLIENKPDYNQLTHSLHFSDYSFNGSEISANYYAVENLTQEPQVSDPVINNELADAYEAIAFLSERVSLLEGGL